MVLYIPFIGRCSGYQNTPCFQCYMCFIAYCNLWFLLSFVVNTLFVLKSFIHQQEINNIHLWLKLLIKLLVSIPKRIYLHVVFVFVFFVLFCFVVVVLSCFVFNKKIFFFLRLNFLNIMLEIGWDFLIIFLNFSLFIFFNCLFS